MRTQKILRPDAKGRVCLGILAKGVSGYEAIINKANKEITLKPYTEVPCSEKWLFKNEEARASIKRGLKQSAGNKTVYKGSFAKYLDEDK